jgi:PAS domain S-box-containing protein
MDGSLDAAARRLAAIVEFSDDAIVSKDLNGIVTSWNLAAERMFGYTAAEAVGRSITLIVPADRLSEEEHVLREIRAGHAVDHFETMRRRKDGTLLPVSLTISPIRDNDGRVVGASKIARDVSERRRAEEALAAAEARQADLRQRLVALVAASGTLFGSPKMHDVLPALVVLARTLLRADGYAVWLLDARAKEWRIGASHGISEAFSRMLVESFRGEDVSAVAFTEPLIVSSVADTPLLEDRARALRQEGIESMMAVPLTIGGHGTGTLVFYYRTPHQFDEVEVQTARALGNLAAAAITSAELFEAQRRSREQAERANRQTAFLAEASAALGSSLDYEETLRTVAQLAVPQIADWCAVDVVDEHGEVQRLAVSHIDSAQASTAGSAVADVIGFGTALMRPNVIVVPLTAHRRTFGALTFVYADSARTYSDVDFRFAHDMAYRAALAVENARAYRQVQAANRAKDEFLATLSHELRTPLNAVLGWARMLRGGAVSQEKMARAFEVVERNALAQLDLVEDLLDLSRVITGKFRLDVQPVSLTATINAAVEAIQPAAAAKGITVKVDAGSDESLISGDEARLQQVIWNLLSNAIKFTLRGGRVTVTLRRQESQFEIEVSDTGEGIEPAVLPYVFDRFRQGDSGTTRTHQGLGLGLAIVRHIVELHGGRVDVASPGKGQGATFMISLPFVQPVRIAALKSGRDVVIPARRPYTAALSGVRALVVDDDGDTRELLAEVLRSRGVVVTAVSSVEEGLAALDREVPDILLSDIAMPDRDGFDLIRRVRERPADRGGHVPAVAITAYARPEDTERSLASGYQMHVTKPVDMDELIATVASLTAIGRG